ncbi:MAG TPA: transposase [Steroidobacteraceae bacterium]|nr:transposase [Steroidobacteraceae bacterium]
MPRPRRIDIPEGTYYVVQRGSKYGSVFLQPDDYALFESLLPAALRRSAALLHAYCWMPDAIHLVVQIKKDSVSRFIQRLSCAYARLMNRRLGGRGHFFQDRHSQKLIDPDAYLLKLVKYIHYIPALEDATPSLDAYPHSSHQAYLGLCDVPWLHKDTAIRLLDRANDGRGSYQNLMSEAPPLQAVKLFKRGDPNTPGILGSPSFVNDLPRGVRPYRSKISLEEITANVARLRGISEQMILSKSRARGCVIARAMITWYAIERSVASMNQVARYLRRDPSSLSVAITRYTVLRPDLFTLTMFQRLIPIGQWPSAALASPLVSGPVLGSDEHAAN